MTNDDVNTKYNTSGEVIKTQKLFIRIPIIQLHNDSIKLSLECGFPGPRLESDEIIIGDTSLRKYMLPQVKNE